MQQRPEKQRRKLSLVLFHYSLDRTISSAQNDYEVHDHSVTGLN